MSPAAPGCPRGAGAALVGGERLTVELLDAGQVAEGRGADVHAAVSSRAGFDPVQEEPVDAVVAGHLGMKGEADVRALPHRHRFVAEPRQHLHRGADLLDAGGADEHPAEGDVAERGDGEVGLEGVDLAAPRVAPHRDVERPGGDLVGPAVGDRPAEQDEAGARGQRGHPSRQPVPQWLLELERPQAACSSSSTPRRGSPGHRPTRSRRRAAPAPRSRRSARRRRGARGHRPGGQGHRLCRSSAAPAELAAPLRAELEQRHHHEVSVPRRPGDHPAYQPRVESSSSRGIPAMSMPRMAGPSPALTSAMTSGLSKYVVAATIALA